MKSCGDVAIVQLRISSKELLRLRRGVVFCGDVARGIGSTGGVGAGCLVRGVSTKLITDPIAFNMLIGLFM